MDDEEKTEEEEVKIGARNSRRDSQRLQQIHDYAVENGAICKGGKALEPDEISVVFGAEVKALDGGKVAGYLVRFSTANDPDLTGDYFTAETDFGDFKSSPVLYQHGMDKQIKRRKLGEGDLKKDDAGVWIEAQLNIRDEYEKAVYELARAGKLGWSSGTAGHLVERDGTGKILAWPLGLDASLTPTPAEYRNIVTLKSIIISDSAQDDKETNQPTAAKAAKDNDMEATEIKTLLEENNKAIVASFDEKVETAAKSAVEKVLDGLPEIKARMGATVQVTVDEADRPFKSVGEQLIAIAKYTQKGVQHPRMKALFNAELKAALGANEAVPSQGEFLLEPTITAGLLKPIHDAGVFSQSAQKLPVGPNSNSGWINGVDETSRATGSRWGGVRGYHLAEAGSLTSSKPKFRRINWELHKVGVLVYATDELLNDAGLLTAIINQSAGEEFDFMVNDDILNGIGGDRPVGVLNSSCLISVSRVATTAIGHGDILAMWQRMLPRNRANAVWYVNSEAEPQLDALTFTSGSTGILSPYVRYDVNGVMNIKGRPVKVTEFNAALGTAGDILLADMSEYLFWEKNAIEAASSIHVQFLTDETAFRFIYRYDGQTALASAITPYKGTNTQSPFVTLLATT